MGYGRGVREDSTDGFVFCGALIRENQLHTLSHTSFPPSLKRPDYPPTTSRA